MGLLPRVKLRVRESRSDRDQTVCLDRSEARHALDAVRRGKADLIALSVPRNLVGILELRKGGAPWASLLSLQPSVEQLGSNAWTASSAQVNAVAEALSDLESDVRLSFGIFGQYVAFTRRQQIGTQSCLSPDTRRRLVWYCQANGLPRTKAAGAVDVSASEDLIDAFHRISPRPYMIAHRNLLRQRLRIEGSTRSAQ